MRRLQMACGFVIAQFVAAHALTVIFGQRCRTSCGVKSLTMTLLVGRDRINGGRSLDWVFPDRVRPLISGSAPPYFASAPSPPLHPPSPRCWGVGHNFMHQSDSKAGWWRYVMDMVPGISSSEFRVTHALSHHLVTNMAADWGQWRAVVCLGSLWMFMFGSVIDMSE